MTKLNKTQFVTLLLLGVTILLALSAPANAEIYRIELKDKKKVISTRLLDTEKPAANGAVNHVAGGIAAEVKDKTASCGVFVQKEPGKTSQASVMVSLIENGTSTEAQLKSVVSNSGLLSKKTIPESEQRAVPNSSGSKSLSVEAPKLHRSCTVSVL